MDQFPEELVRKRRTRPADPGSVQHWYILIGLKGAVQFAYMDSDPDSEPEVAERRKIQNEEWVQRFGHPLWPLATDVGYHALEPQYEDHHEISCDVVLSGKCYYDGSGLRAEEWLKTWIANGKTDEWMWDRLKQEYFDRFYGDDKPFTLMQMLKIMERGE